MVTLLRIYYLLKEFWKSVSIFEIMGESIGGLFFLTHIADVRCCADV